MKKYALFLLFPIFICTTSDAADEFISKQIKPYLSPPLCKETQHDVTSSNVISNHPTLYTQCLQDICGTSPSIVDGEDKLIENFVVDLESVNKNLINPLLERSFDEIEAKAEQALEQLTEQEQQEAMDEFYFRLANDTIFHSLSVYTQQIFQEVSELVRSGAIAQESMYAEIHHKVHEVLKRELNQDMADAYFALSVGNIERNKWAKEQAQLFLKANPDKDKALAQIEARVNKIPDHFPSEKSSLLAQLEIYKLIQTPDQHQLVSYIDQETLLVSLLKAENTLAGENLKAKRKNLVEKFHELLASWNEGETEEDKQAQTQPEPLKEQLKYQLKQILEVKKDECRGSIQKEMSQLLNSEDAATAREKALQAKFNFAEGLKRSGLYSRSTLKAISEFIHAVNLQTPPSHKDYLRTIQQHAHKTHQSMNRSPQFYFNVTLAGDPATLCGVLPSHNLDNFYKHGEGLPHSSIYLSNNSLLNFEQVGLNVLNHELSHAVSYAIQLVTSSKSSFRTHHERKKCLGMGHVEATGFSRMFADPVEQFQEEDFADILPAKLFQQSSNLGCNLLIDGQPTTPDRNARTTQTPNDSSDPNDWKVHSSSVFRILNIQLNLGHKLPKSCRGPMKQENLKLKFPTSCFEKE